MQIEDEAATRPPSPVPASQPSLAPSPSASPAPSSLVPATSLPLDRESFDISFADIHSNLRRLATHLTYGEGVYDAEVLPASAIGSPGSESNGSFGYVDADLPEPISGNDVPRGETPLLSRPPFLARHPLLGDLVSDERNFYSCSNLTWVAAGVGGAAIFANTNADEWFRQTYTEHLRPVDSNLDFVKDFGTGGIVIPAMAGLWLVDQCIDWSTGDEKWPVVECVGDWSGRSLRGWIVGAVPLLTLQSVTGASRPGVSHAGSHWTPLVSSHGVSGHAFIGAVPFFTAADMTDVVPYKIGFYAIGSAAGISRLYTDSHYFSQVALGWWLAYFSTKAVSETVTQNRRWQITPLPSADETGLAITYQY